MTSSRSSRRGWVVLVVVGVLTLSTGVRAQAVPDLSGTWMFNQAKSGSETSGNAPAIPFASELVIKQSADELAVRATTPRQAPITAVYKLDGSTVSIESAPGITETGEARFEQGNLVVATHRSFSSPVGTIRVEFKEVWRLEGTVLTVEKTRMADQETVTRRGVYERR